MILKEERENQEQEQKKKHKKAFSTSFITERDAKILQFINEFGFCELSHIMQHFAIYQSNAYKIMKHLMRKDLILHRRIYHGKRGIYYLSRDGASFTDLPILDNLPENKYKHQLAVIDLYIKLKKSYPQAYWLSERWLLKDRSKADVKDKKHMPDGLLIFPDGRQIAIEVELTLKGKKRLFNIFKSYGSQFQINEVWYFCAAPLIGLLTTLAEKRPYIKIHSLDKILNESK